MTQHFNVGDTVCLRSGGVALTVDEMKPDGVRVTWIDETGAAQASIFSPYCLARIVHACVEIESGMHRCVWLFEESGLPIAQHILTAQPLGKV